MSAVCLFWASNNVDKGYSEWLNTKPRLSPLHILSLKAHERIGNPVKLYTYQKLNIKKELPKNIEIKNAEEIVPSVFVYKALRSGHSIAHISDLIRILAAVKYSGIILDMDAVALKPFPGLDTFYSTGFAKKTGGVAPSWGEANPPIKIHDDSWDGKALLNFPAKISEGNKKYFLELVDKIYKKINQKARPRTINSWNYVMNGLNKVVESDKKGVVFQPNIFTPVPWWSSKKGCYSVESPTRLNGKTYVYGVRLLSMDEIFKGSITVQHYFESVCRYQKIKSSLDFVREGSLLFHEMRYILGDNWRDAIASYIDV